MLRRAWATSALQKCWASCAAGMMETIGHRTFRALCAEFLPPGTSDPRLENFFDTWVYGTGVPTLKLTYS